MHQQEHNDAEGANPGNWSVGNWSVGNWSVGLYFSKRDSRVWIPKSVPWMHWTLDLGVRAART